MTQQTQFICVVFVYRRGGVQGKENAEVRMIWTMAPGGIEDGCVVVQGALRVLRGPMKGLLGLAKGDIGGSLVVHVNHQKRRV
jgi:hypothetical protein